MPTIQVADKPTLDTVNSRVENILTDIGATNATGGSTTAGTIMGKLNKIISDFATHMGRWTATRAGYIDTINTNAARLTSARATIIDSIGSTGDTGGSATAGTVMAKLNAIANKSSGGTTLKTVTPSSTNIVTLGTNLKNTITGATDVVNSNTSTYTKYVQYPGIYRFYCTYALDIASYTSGQGGWTSTWYINVYKLGTSTTTSLSKTLANGATADIAATTFTMDVPLETGDRVQTYVANTSAGTNLGACGATLGVSGTATISDLSIRGTQNVIDAAFV